MEGDGYHRLKLHPHPVGKEGEIESEIGSHPPIQDSFCRPQLRMIPLVIIPNRAGRRHGI